MVKNPFSEHARTAKKSEFDILMTYWNTLGFLVLVGLIGASVESFVGYRSIGFLFLLAVLMIGFVGQLGPVLFAAGLSALGWNFFFIPPRLTFSVSAPEDLLMCVTYFGVALAVGLLANRLKRQELILQEKEERTHFLYEILLDLSTAEQDDFLRKIVRRMEGVLNGHCGVKLLRKDSLEPGRSYLFHVSGSDQDAAEFCLRAGKLAGWSTEFFPDAKALYIPIPGHAETLGVFKYRPKEPIPLSIEQENLLLSVCRQLGFSLEQKQTERLRESEKMHQTLLHSISHELRTPLTALLAAATTLQKSTLAHDENSRSLLAATVKSSGERLNRMIENLLDMSRLNARENATHRQWHDLSDLVGVTVSRLYESFENAQVKIEMDEGLPLVEMDFKLMEHALFNLLVNAVTYSPPDCEILLQVRRGAKSIDLSVIDQGPGIPVEFQKRIFEKFFRIPGTAAGGTGLGLAIAKSIVEFHSGEIKVVNRAEGGAQFILSLPLKEGPTLPEEFNEQNSDRR